MLAVVLALPLALYFVQDSLIFHPQPMSEASRKLVAAQGESVFIEAADGTRLHAWHRKGSPLILYFGGNAEEVSWMLARAARHAPGTGWLLVDYRGYGSSAGAPSEKTLVADALAWHDHATRELGAARIFVFGRSLGSGVAVQLAAARPVAGVVVVAPYDSLTSVARRYYPFLPVGLMLKHPFDSASRRAVHRCAASVPRRRTRRSDSRSPFEASFRRVACAEAVGGAEGRRAQ